MADSENLQAGEQLIQGYLIPIRGSESDNVVSLAKLLAVARARKYRLLLTVALFVTLGVGGSFLLTPKYRAEVLLAASEPPGSSGTLGGLSSQLGGLAALAGVDLRSNDRTSEYIAMLGSRQFTIRFVEANTLMPILFERKWDTDTESWSADLDEEDIPNENDAFRLVNKKVRTVFEDRRNGLVTLAIEWKDPVLAADWANRMVQQLNEFVRQRDIAEAQSSIEFLDKELTRTTNPDMRRGISQLIQSQIEVTMLANVRPDYAFRVIDPAVIANDDDYIWPNRVVIALIFLILGMLAAMGIVMYVLLRDNSTPGIDTRPD